MQPLILFQKVPNITIALKEQEWYSYALLCISPTYISHQIYLREHMFNRESGIHLSTNIIDDSE